MGRVRGKFSQHNALVVQQLAARRAGRVEPERSGLLQRSGFWGRRDLLERRRDGGRGRV